MESYSRGRRGVPAKDVGVERRARVQIPHSPPSKNTTIYGGIFCLFSAKYCDCNFLGTFKAQFIKIILFLFHLKLAYL